MRPEEKAEIILFDWLKTKSKNVKEIYFNRVNKLNAPTFKVIGNQKKPDFIVLINRGYGNEYIAIEIKYTSSSRNIHESGKILMYYENYISGQTKYIIDGVEIKIDHFAVATEKSIEGYLFPIDNEVISNEKSSDDWRNTNSKLNLMPKFEHQRTSDYLRRLWSEWRLLKKRIDKEKMKLPSIGIIISNPTIDKLPYLQTMIYSDWLIKKKWCQRWWLI